MNTSKLIYPNLFFISASVLCFEIISTRISSVIFVNDYAFFILSLAILGLGTGGIFSYYKIKETIIAGSLKIISRSLLIFGVSLCVFIVSITEFSITSPFIYFFLQFLPFFFAGIVYAQIFKIYAEESFKLYASDLAGGALGSVTALSSFSLFGAANSIFILAVIIFGTAVSFTHSWNSRMKIITIYSVLLLSFLGLLKNGKTEFLKRVPVGNYIEKDIYHVYPNLNVQSQIIDSRWSIYGRSDLVQYSHQDAVQQLFIDGSAGTQVYRFNGNVKKTNSMLQRILLHHSNAIPFLFLKENEKKNMLIIGPGGGKEVLIGLFSNVKKITGVEINSDFVDIVKAHKDFDGGIYTDFPNVEIEVKEGRHYIKQSKDKYDLIVMALPSTEQMQSIEPFAMSENYLLTKEAIQDYLNTLTPEGRLIFTVHNKWELMRLMTTAISAFEEIGVATGDVQNHFAVLEVEYAPTIVIKRNAFTKNESLQWQNIIKTLPQEFPAVTYLPLSVNNTTRQSTVNYFLTAVSKDKESVQRYIEQDKYDISSCSDDKPYFYKINKGVPDEYLWLLLGIAGFNIFVVWLPLRFIRTTGHSNISSVTLPLTVFICTGIGFMILEVSLFQKLILYLGSPTVSLSILLSSILIGMGTGSVLGGKIYEGDHKKRLYVISMFIVVSGILLFISYPYILSQCLLYSLAFRSTICFIIILPFAFLLGIPFPSCIQLLKQENIEKYIPWMYGVNGAMSVLGSVLAVILSMLFGFTLAFFIGLCFYLLIFLLLYFSPKKQLLSSIRTKTMIKI
jgi:spermidine synthase